MAAVQHTYAHTHTYRWRTRTWHAEEGLTGELVQAALPVHLAQVAAGTRVGVTRVDDLLHHAVAEGTGDWGGGEREEKEEEDM